MSIVVPDPETDPTLVVAARQLVLLGELVEIVMEATRAFGASAVAAAQAEKMILSEDWFTPEVGRARACGAKDAADSLQKVTRAARLTMKLQMAVAEIVRDIRAGVVPVLGDGASAAGGPSRRIVFGDLPDAAAPGAEADDEGRPAREERFGDRELAEFDRAEALPRGSYSALVDRLAADGGAVVDWSELKVRAMRAERRDAVLTDQDNHREPLGEARSGAIVLTDRAPRPPNAAHPGDCRDPDQRSECLEFSG